MVVGQVIGKVAQKAAKKGIEKLVQQLLKNKIQKEGIASLSEGIKKKSYNRLKSVYNQFGRGKSEERILARENAAASELNNNFATKVIKLSHQKQENFPKQTKYTEDIIKDWVKINEGTFADKQYIIQKFREAYPNSVKNYSLINNLDNATKRYYASLGKVWEKRTFPESMNVNPIKDEAIQVGLSNLKAYAWDPVNKGSTGRNLRGDDLRRVLWGDEKKYWNLYKNPDDFSTMLNQVFKKQYADYFPKIFNQYASPVSRKTSLEKQQIPLQNKNFIKILNYLNIPKDKFSALRGHLNLIDDINIMGAKNTQKISDVVGTAHTAAKNMKDAHPALTNVVKHNVHNLINRTFTSGFKFDKTGDISIDKMMKLTEKMKDPKWAEAYIDLLNKRLYYTDFFKLAEKMTGVKGVSDINLTGFDRALHISHKKALKDYYQLGLDINNLFLQGDIKNLKQGAKTVSAGGIRDELKLLTDRMEDHYYQVMGLNRGGLINDPLTATMHSGGFMDYGEMKPVLPLLEPGEVQHLQLGGKIAEKIAKEAAKAGVKYVKRQILPKVIGHVEKIVPKLTATKEALKKSIKDQWILSESVRDVKWSIKSYGSEKEANAGLNEFLKSSPEKKGTLTIDKISAKEAPVKETVTAMEKMPAMVWKTPTVIKNSPMEMGRGNQWLAFLKKSVSPKELEDTSIGPYLEFHVPNERISKQQLLKAFNEVSPKFDVIPLGKRDTVQMVSKITEKFNNIRGRMEGFSKQDKKALNVFEGSFAKLGQAEQMAGPLKEKDATYNLIGNEINRVMKQLYDIDNAVMNVGALRDPRIPAPIRSIFGDLQELLKIRGAKHAFQSSPQHAGQQVLPGGINYREYMFKSSPGSLRLNEPVYKPGHSFDLSEEMAAGTFVHTRISDRTDNFGRKLLFVEEIQSDMHQKIQAALRSGEGGGYATRQDKIAGIEPVVREMEKVQMQIDQVLAKNPKDAKLPGLYNKRETLSDEIVLMRAKIGELSQSGTPEGPFQRSEDYGSFVAKYLLRLAKEGNYDGVAVSTGAIKNRLKSEARGNLMDEEATGHYGFYDAIMQNALKKIAKKGNLDYTYTVINDGIVNWGNVPVLLLKAGDKVLEGLPAFREGGLVRENFVDVVPLL